MDTENNLLATASGGIQSLDAALHVLRVMVQLDGAVGVSELARECDMPISKTHRYLASFIHAGLVRQSGRAGKYDLGPTAIELGLAALQRHDFVNWAADDLPELVARSGLTALLCVWSDSGPTVVRWERAASFVVTSMGLGTTLPLLTSATGRAFLAYLPESVSGKLLRQELARAKASQHLFPDMAANIKGATDLVERMREAGYATVDGRFIPGLIAVAAPVLDWQGWAQAVVTLIGTDRRAIEPDSAIITILKQFCNAHSLPRRQG